MDKYKMIAIDLDDTLLQDNLTVSKRAVQAIKAAREKGVYVTIATGRMYRAALPYAKELGIDVPLITYQGALVKNSLSGEVLVNKPVPFPLAKEIVALAKERKLHINVYIKDELFVEGITEEGLHYSRLAGVSLNPVEDLLEFMTEEPTKLLIIADEKEVAKLKDEFKSKYNEEELHVTTSKPYFLEILHPEATKASALEHLSQLYDVKQEEIIALGDSYNDLEMLKFAGLGIVMGNGAEEIKKIADFVGPSNEEDGVAKAIEKFVLRGGD